MIVASHEVELLKRARDLLPRLDPALQSPLYLLPVNELPEWIALRANYPQAGCSFTAPFLDLLTKELLQKRGEWCGRGFAAVLQPPEEFHHAIHFLSVCVHEASHFACLSQGARCVSEETLFDTAPEVKHFLTPEVWAANRREAETTQIPAQREPWADHGEKFLRANAHLIYRAHRLGVRLSEGLAAGHHYGLRSHARVYARALGVELVERAGEPLDAILKSEAPGSFSRLWLTETSAYWRRELWLIDERLRTLRRVVAQYGGRSADAKQIVRSIEGERARVEQRIADLEPVAAARAA